MIKLSTIVRVCVAMGCIILMQIYILRGYYQNIGMVTRKTAFTTAKLVETEFRNGATLNEISNLQCKKMLKNVTVLDVPNVDLTTDSQVFGSAFGRCSSFKTKYRFSEDPVSDEEINFPIAYTILIHENVQQFVRLLSAIYTTNNYYCVHLDAKANLETEKATEAVTSCFPNVIMSSRRESVTYASFERLQADLNCMKDLLNIENETMKWKYLINLCGQDYPIRTNIEIVHQLRALRGTNIIPGQDVSDNAVETLKRTNWKYEKGKVNTGSSIETRMVQTNISHPPTPHNPTMRKNLAYNIFSRAFLQWVLYESKEAADILNWSKPTYSPDEHYWLLVNTLPGAPGGRNATSWWSVVKYIHWIQTGSNTVCHGYGRHGVCVFGSGDLPRLVQRYELFINKINIRFDSDVMTCLRHWLSDRNGYKIPTFLIPTWV